jgi:hypothetical protein
LKTEKETCLRATPLMARQNCRGFVGAPVAGYLTWREQMLGNNGIVPMFCIDSREALRERRDSQQKAVNMAKTLQSTYVRPHI